MYKLLLATDQEDIQALFRDHIRWDALNCRPPLIASSAPEAIELLNSRAVDAVGYYFSDEASAPLTKFLRYGRPSLPIFEASAQAERQMTVLGEVIALLDRLHADFADEYYDEETMLAVIRDEFVHSLLAGEIGDRAVLDRELQLVRARFDADERCVLYEIDMPQGDVYLSEHQGHAQQRLERALRNNFFGRVVDGVYYAVAVLTPRHIRLACVPMQHEEEKDLGAFAFHVDEHVQDSIQRIKEYLDLDMSIRESVWLDGVKELLCPPQQ